MLRRLGQRVERLSKEVADAERALDALLAEVAPDLLEECGVGPVCGAQLLVSSGDPSRMTSEASFAAPPGEVAIAYAHCARQTPIASR